MFRVLIADDLSPRAIEIFRARGIEADLSPGLSAAELEGCIADYDGLAVRSATKATAKLIGRATRLKVIGRAGIGIDNIDLAAATQRGIVVMNTPHGNSVTAAEHAIAMMFALARQIRRRTVRQDPGHHRLRQHRIDRRRSCAWAEDEGDRLRSLSFR